MQAACADPAIVSGPSRRGTRHPALVSAAMALGATACFSDRGVAIEVDVGDTGATTVELFLGKDACEKSDATAIDCTGIAPPDTAKILSGKIWFRDTADRYQATVSGRTATFRLQADSTTVLPIVIAVGSAPPQQGTDPRPVAAATMLDLEIPAHDARVVTTRLVPANPVAPPTTDPRKLDEDRVAVWAGSNAPSTCVAVEHWRSAPTPIRTFIVPEQDPDCDGLSDVSERECNPAAYLGSSLSGGAEPALDCAIEATGHCTLGSHACVDGQEPMTTCLPPVMADVCVPSAVCNCPDLEQSCLENELASQDPPPPQIECDVPMGVDGKPCPSDADHLTKIDLDAKYGQATCGTDPQIGGLLAGFARSHDFGGAIFEVGAASAPCHFPLKWAGGARGLLESTDDRGALALKTRDGGVVLPLVLHFKLAACGTIAFSCRPAGNESDSMWSCVQ